MASSDERKGVFRLGDVDGLGLFTNVAGEFRIGYLALV
jgi:hypothetical protein